MPTLPAASIPSSALRHRRVASRLLLATCAAALAASVQAQEAITTKQVNLRAGPDRGYPLVTWLAAGTAVQVNGCLSDYRWCDVTAGPDRGWVFARNLQYSYQGQPVAIYGNGAQLALPIIGFILGSYWSDYYRDRPWYRSQNQWNNWRPGNRPPPVWRPPPQPPRPPVVRPQPPRPPGVRPPRPPVIQPQPSRPIPMPKPP